MVKCETALLNNKGKRKQHPTLSPNSSSASAASNDIMSTRTIPMAVDEKPRLVLVGAGYANLQVTKLLADSKHFQSITLIDVQPFATYCGVIPCSLARRFSDVVLANNDNSTANNDATIITTMDEGDDDAKRREQQRQNHDASTTTTTAIDLQHHCHLLNIHFINDGVLDIDIDKCLIYLTESTDPIPYDVMSLDIGSAIKALDSVPGAFGYAIPVRPMHELEDRLEQAESEFMTRGNPFVDKNYKNKDLPCSSSSSLDSPPNLVRLAIVGGGALAIELALCMEARWRPLLGDRLRIVLVTSESALFPPELATARRIVKKILMEKQITLCFHANVVKVEEHLLCLQTGMKIPFTYCLWATGEECHDLAKTLQQRGLDVTKDGWIRVKESLQSTSHSNIFAAGDCCASDTLTLPKAGGIHTLQEGPILAHNLEHYALQEGLEVLELSLSPSSPLEETGTNTITTSSGGSMQFISCGDGTAIGFAFGIPMRGKWVWAIKNAMNQEFFSLLQNGVVDDDKKKHDFGNRHGNRTSTTTTTMTPTNQHNPNNSNTSTIPLPMEAAKMLRCIDVANYRLAWATLQYMTRNESYRSEVLHCYSQLQEQQEMETRGGGGGDAEHQEQHSDEDYNFHRHEQKVRAGAGAAPMDTTPTQDFSVLRTPQPAV